MERNSLTPREILALPMDENEAGAATVGGYLARLAAEVVREGEGFSGKRPFGDSGWEYDLYKPLIVAGVVGGSLDEDGFIETVAAGDADALLAAAALKMVAAPSGLDMARVESALRDIISDLDYDLAKSIEDPEDGGEDGFPALARRFAGWY